jgi:hypothetical protein
MIGQVPCAAILTIRTQLLDHVFEDPLLQVQGFAPLVLWLSCPDER